MIISYEPPSPESIEVLNALRDAVTEALEKKRRLGQYAVFWQDDRPIFIGDDAPPPRADKIG
jgi:hypothetical protein